MISRHKLALVVGSFLGLWHLAWSTLVALGYAQQLIDFAFRIHFIQPPYILMPFKLSVALVLVVITFVLGYLFGLILATIWNWLDVR